MRKFRHRDKFTKNLSRQLAEASSNLNFKPNHFLKMENRGIKNLDNNIPIAWKHNYKTGKTTVYIGSKRKLSKDDEDAIAGYVMAQCYPDLFQKWIRQKFGQDFNDTTDFIFKI